MRNNCFLLSIVGLIVGLTACQSSDKVSVYAAESAVTIVPALQPNPALPPNSSAASDSRQLLAPFIPAGYQVLYTVSGDLNRDAWLDRVAILDTIAAVNDSTEWEDRSQILSINRPLLLLLGQADGKAYTLAARNDNVVMCADCSGAMGGDPLQQVIIKKGFFSIEHYGGSAWRWTDINTFKYNPADHQWYLHRAGGEIFHATSPEKMEKHVRTVRDFGRISFTDYKYSEKSGR